MSGGGGAIKGYWYSLGIHMGICRGPVNSIVETRVGDKPVLPIFLEITDSVIFPLYNPGLFGGTDGEGGIAGPLNVMMGKDDQLCPPELALMNFPTPQPGFRRICSVFFDGFVAAINPYPKPWTFRVRRTTKGWDGDPWYPEKAMIELTRPFSPSEITSTPIIHAMNPAHIFYEVMTNREWGRGLPRAALDDANLRAVADTLYAEGFGMCLYWSRSDDIETFVQSILDHIGAVLRPNLTTGELQLKLLRKDYVVADLPLFDNESGLLDITEASVAAMPTIINHCKVTFKDPITGKDGSVGTHNLAGVKGSNGEINTLEKSYPGLPTPDLAARVALRDLRASSNALRRFSVTLDRRGQDVQPGDVIRVRDMTRGIGEVVVRIGKYEEGNNLDGRITLSAVQDIFRMTPTSFTGNQPPTWEAPNTSPCIGYNRSFEMPYFMLAHTMSAADLDYLGDDTGFLGEVVELGGRPMNAGYKIATRIGLPTEDDLPDADTSYCPTVPANWDGGDCVLIVGGDALMIMQGTINNEGEIPDFPGLYEWHSVDGAVTYPTAGVATFNPVYPGWGPVTSVNTVEDGTHWAESSIAMLFTPSTAAVLGASFELNMYDVTDGDALFYTTTMYRGGGTYSTDIDVALYVERPVANCSNTLLPWPEYPLNDLPQVPSPYLGRDGHVIRYEMGDGAKVVEACCTCLEISMSGVSSWTDPENTTTVGMNSVITVPSDLSQAVSSDPVSAPQYVDISGGSGAYLYSDNSFRFEFVPADHPYLTSVLSMKVYNDDDGGALVYSSTLYKAGNSAGLGAQLYFERPVADAMVIPWPEFPGIHPTLAPNPMAAYVGNNLRIVLSTASACCGGLPPDPTDPVAELMTVGSPAFGGDLAYRVNDEVFLGNTGRKFAQNYSGPRVMHLKGGCFFVIYAIGDDGLPLPAEDQPTDWVLEDNLDPSNVAGPVQALIDGGLLLTPTPPAGAYYINLNTLSAPGEHIARYYSPSKPSCDGTIRAQLAKTKARVMASASWPTYTKDYAKPVDSTGAFCATGNNNLGSTIDGTVTGTGEDSQPTFPWPVVVEQEEMMTSFEAYYRCSVETGDYTYSPTSNPAGPWCSDIPTLTASLLAAIPAEGVSVATIYVSNNLGFSGSENVLIKHCDNYVRDDYVNFAEPADYFSFDQVRYSYVHPTPVISEHAWDYAPTPVYWYGPFVGHVHQGGACDPGDGPLNNNRAYAPLVGIEVRIEDPIED